MPEFEDQDSVKHMGEDEAAVRAILGEMPDVQDLDIDVPSKGLFYNLGGDSKIRIRPMTFNDEKKMAAGAQTGDPEILNKFLNECVLNFDIYKLLLMDKISIVLQLRCLSYGSEYDVAITCPECNYQNEIKFDLNTLNIKDVPDEFTNPVEILLPTINKKALVRLPFVGDEPLLKNYELLASNLWRFINSVDGNSKKTVISKVVEMLPIKDIHAIIKVIGGAGGYGVDTDIKLACTNCNVHTKVEMPITPDFFLGS